MHKPVKDSVFLVEAVQDASSERRIATFIQQKHRVRHVIRDLKKPALLCCRKVGNVGQVIQDSPLSAEPSKVFYLQLRALLIVAFSEHDQAALRIVVIMRTTIEKSVKPLHHLLGGALYCVFAIELSILLDNSGE